MLSGRKLFSPHGNLTRPTKAIVREALMNILRDKITNCNWLDLYSGSGIIGCEVIERGAKVLVAIEVNRKILEICQTNIATISESIQNQVFIDLVNADVNNFLKVGFESYSLNENKRIHFKNSRFDYIYIDPPYVPENKDSFSYLKELENYEVLMVFPQSLH